MAEFVTFELAKKLKEKGYPQLKKDTLAMYCEYGEWFSLAQNLDEYEYSFVDFDEHDCVAPTISQALKWLREEKKIHIGVLYHGYYAVWIQPMKRNEAEHVIHDCKTYEEAELAGIEYVLNNLI